MEVASAAQRAPMGQYLCLSVSDVANRPQGLTWVKGGYASATYCQR